LNRVLIISPYFAPTNAADMQRIRMSLPYFNQFGWEAEVVAVDPVYADLPTDKLLTQSIPSDLKVHYVKALDKKITSKLGLGSIALRSLYFYRSKVNQLLKEKEYHLIYFSTTQFPVCILGAYWQKQFGVPYVIDMQDPWHSDYYKKKPKHQQPPKYWFSYRLNKFLEPRALKKANGLISVSAKYINDLKIRYPEIKNIPTTIIPFGAFDADIKIAQDNEETFPDILTKGFKNIVCVGRGGLDMHAAIAPLFEAVARGLTVHPQLFKNLRLYFIGTSYAPDGQGIPTIVPLAKQWKIDQNVIEITNRISYYHTLSILNKADALFIPGSDDPGYTPSKLYPYLLTKKPLLAVVHSNSPANKILQEYQAKFIYNYDSNSEVVNEITNFLTDVLNEKISNQTYNTEALEKYSAQNLTNEQCKLFNKVLIGKA
jgi:ribosomal protein S17E